MKQLFKTTLLAGAVAAMCGTANAGTLSVVKQTHSKEGLAGVTDAQKANSTVISYKLAAAYREGDKLTFKFSGGLPADATTSFPTVINMPPVNSDKEADAIAGLTLGLLNSTADSVTYRVTKLTLPQNVAKTQEYQNGSTLGAVLKLGTNLTSTPQIGVPYLVKALTGDSSSISVTVTSETSVGDVLDNAGTRTAVIAEAKSQFGTAKIGPKFDATIDVASMRKAFVGVTSDSMGWSVSNPDTTGWLNMASVNASKGTVVTLLGEAGKMTGLKAANWSTVGGTRNFTETDSKLVVDYNGMVTNDVITFTPTTGDKAVVLETQSFSSKIEYNYTSAYSQAGIQVVGAGLPAGEWTLNGATVNIPYMPYGPSASQIIYVTNAGGQTGDISVTAFDDKGVPYDLGVLDIKAGATRVTKIGPEINRKLQEKGFNGTKASITITVNAPEADITVYASYNIGSADRGYINTDQYKGIE